MVPHLGSCEVKRGKGQELVAQQELCMPALCMSCWSTVPRRGATMNRDRAGLLLCGAPLLQCGHGRRVWTTESFCECGAGIARNNEPECAASTGPVF